MKKIILSSLLITVTIFSCNRSSEVLNDFSTNSDKDKTITFQGETIRLQKGLTQSDFDEYFSKIDVELAITGKNARSSKIDYSWISLEEMYNIIGFLLLKYPDLNKEEFSDEDMVIIKKDLPSIKTKEDAKVKKSIIFDYYNVLVRKELKEELEKEKKKLRGKATNEYAGTDFEKMFADADPIGGYCFGKIAKEEAEIATSQIFGDYLPDDVKLNAFKHAVWNAIGVQEIVQRSGNKWNALERSKKFGCAHEYVLDNNNTWIIPMGIKEAMDLHNNLMGRTYMYNNINTGWFGAVTYVPSDDKIRDDIKNYVFSKVYNTNDVMSLSNSYTWYSLGEVYNAMNYHTVPGQKLVYVLD